MAQTHPDTDNRLMILEGAEAVISSAGIDELTYSALATQTGLSKGTLYYYFPSKEELLVEIADRHVERVSSDLVELTENELAASGEPRLESILETLFARILGDNTRSVIHFHMVSEALQGNAHLSDRLAESYRRWISTMRDTVSRIDPGGIPDRSAFVVAALDGLIIQKMLGLGADSKGIASFVAETMRERH